jgi:hypothetical protein
VEGVEGGKFGVEGVAGAVGCGYGFGGGVHLEREECEGVGRLHSGRM